MGNLEHRILAVSRPAHVLRLERAARAHAGANDEPSFRAHELAFDHEPVEPDRCILSGIVFAGVRTLEVMIDFLLCDLVNRGEPEARAEFFGARLQQRISIGARNAAVIGFVPKALDDNFVDRVEVLE